MNSLANLTDNRYKITLEESWHHERPEVRSPDRIWYEQISCEGGAFISVYSLNPLIFHLWTPRPKNARIIWKAIKGAEEVKADFHFEGEAEIFFPLELVFKVADLAGAKRKRRLSEAHKAKLVEMGTIYQFKPKIYGSKRQENGDDLGVLV